MRLGYDLEKTETRVCEIFGIEKGAIFSRSRVKVKADAIAVFCYWAVRELDTAKGSWGESWEGRSRGLDML